MRKIFLSLLGVVAAVFMAACGNSGGDANASSASSGGGSIEQIKKAGVIRIGVFGDMPPFCYLDEKGVNQGYDVVFGRRLAKELLGDESKAQFVLVDASNRVEFLKSNKVDIILANFTQTAERAEQVDFALPYMKVSLGVAVPKDSTVASIEDLADKTTILVKGITADIYFAKNYPNYKALKYDQNTEAFAAMIDGRGDAIAHDNTMLFAWVKGHPDFKMAIKELGDKEVIAPAVKKGDVELKKFVDDLIVKLAAEQFFHQDYELTLKDAFGPDVNAEDVVIEGGQLN